MHPNFFTATALPSIFLILVLIIARLPKSSSDDNEQYVNCGQSFNCANIANIVYPFWGNDRHDYCGHPDFLLDCAGDVPSITIGSRKYRVNAIDSSARVLTVARDDLWGNICPLYLYNTSLLTTFSYVAEDQDVTIYYGCGSPPPTLSAPNLFNCRVNTSFNTASYFVVGNAAFDVDLGLCSQRIGVKVNQTAGRNLALPTTSYALLQSALESGFGLNWDANNTYCGQCVDSGGRCGYNYGSASFACYCADGPRDFTCNASQNENGSGGSGNKSLIVGLPVGGAVVAGIGLAWLTIFCRQRRKRLAAKFARIESKNASSLPSSKTVTVITPTTPSSKSGTDTESIPSYPSSKSDLLKASTYFGAQLFNYSELEEATDNFNSSRELGDGGFGTVYYGKLLDGRTVAVKRLYENNFKRVEQFMNEVEILTKLQHPNLVKLYGCTSKRSRELLLVYEYIPNGTVADHLHGKRANSGLLSWRVRLNIALETADALVYLHKSDVVHRDVKTNNILLDNDFHVKVADFGLSKLFPRDVTHVSTAPQGTPGYVDPEYYQCYQLTEKSDVYSFGVVLVELISSLQAVDTNRHRHDINLFNMAVNKIQNHALNELIDPSLGFEADSSAWRTAKMVAELAFRCLQQEKDMRPSMSEVLEALRGIHNENLNSQKAEVVEVVVEDVALLKNEAFPVSPELHSYL